MKNDKEYLEHLRHSCAHLLAKAVLELYPGAHNAIGPSIENGFYQDFDMGDIKISEADLVKIEKKMKEILPSWKHFEFNEVTLEEAKKLFKHNPYKVELAIEFAGEGKKLSTNNPGNFLDLCKMGHVEDPSKELRNFKLLSVAGAYWRGSEKNQMLTRIYGTAFPTKNELAKYLLMLQEAKKRDHKKLGKELSLFTFGPLTGPGLPLFLPKGATIFHELEMFMREEKEKRGYKFVHTPHMAKTQLYKKSGHLGKYDAMMPIMTDSQGDEYVLKAMNCPHHFEIYNSEPHSYKEMPYRIADNSTVYRNEKSGELSGLVRVKSLTIDDTHHVVRHDQIESEIDMIFGLMDKIYSTFGFNDYRVQISVRDPKDSKKYFGDDKLWQKSEDILIGAVKKWGRPYIVEEGEAAFYGPKIDIMVKDSIGRDWQLTTIQLDFNQPENFQMRYNGEDGKEHSPAILHVAILGSIERFMGVLIEHFAGAFPAWLSPVQVKILPISDKQNDYAQTVLDALKENNIRAELDDRSESVGKKIREAEMEKVPYMLIIGEKEVEAKSVAARARGQKDLGAMKLDKFITKVLEEIKTRAQS